MNPTFFCWKNAEYFIFSAQTLEFLAQKISRIGTLGQ